MPQLPAALESLPGGLGLRLIRFSAAGLAHAFTTRHTWEGAGPGTPDWAPFLAAASLPGPRPAMVSQVHGTRVHAVSRPEEAEGSPPEADALVTRLPGLTLAVRTADCAPVLLADAAAGVIGVAHAGWRGAIAGILEAAVEGMVRLGAKPERIRAAIGPTIGRCCFEVSEEVADPFRDIGPELVDTGPSGRPHVDLAGAAGVLLRAGGLRAGSIVQAGACTRCRPDLFFSYRGDGVRTGRMFAALALSPRPR